MSTSNIPFLNMKRKNTLNYPKSAAMVCFQGTQKRVRNSRGKRAISVRAIEVLLYYRIHKHIDIRTYTFKLIFQVPHPTATGWDLQTRRQRGCGFGKRTTSVLLLVLRTGGLVNRTTVEIATKTVRCSLTGRDTNGTMPRAQQITSHCVRKGIVFYKQSR